MYHELFTTSTEIGISITITIKEARKLTKGEKAMCQSIFGQAIKYEDVYIFHNKFMFRAGSIFGVIIYPDNKKSNDFSIDILAKRTLFIHEMTHAWQFQKGFPVLKAGAEMQLHYEAGANPYKYDLVPPSDDRHRANPDKPRMIYFRDYNMESQAELLSHYYAITTFKTQKDIELALNNKNNYDYLYEVNSGIDIGIVRRIFLKQIVETFIASPKDKDYLPRNPYILGYIRAE